MDIKRRIFILIVCVFGVRTSVADITFAGGGTNDLMITFTSDITIPLTGDLFFNSNFILHDVYASDQGMARDNPSESYGAVGSLEFSIIHAGGGSDTEAAGYADFGTFGFAFNAYEQTDFFGQFFFTADPTTVAGDLIVIKSGTVTIPASVGISAPDFSVKTIEILDHNGQSRSNILFVPEPSSLLLLMMGLAGVLSFRRIRRT